MSGNIEGELQEFLDAISSFTPQAQTQSGTEQSPPPTGTEPLEGGAAMATLIALALVIYLPVVVSHIRHRIWLQLLAFAFCSLGLFGSVALFVGWEGRYALASTILAPTIIAETWGAGLLFGLAATVDGMAERRQRRHMQIATRAPMAPRPR